MTPMKNRRLISLVACSCVIAAILSRAAISDENDASTIKKTDKKKPAAQAVDTPAAPKTDDGASTEKVTGQEIYKFLCASCHGASGEGVAEKHDEPLYGDRSIAALTKIIVETMPEDDPGILTDEQAKDVAQYMHETFYTAEARARNKPPRIELSRLTVSQYLNSVADLIGSFRPQASIDDRRGLAGDYYNARNYARDKKAFDRIDPQIEFDFADKGPSDSISPGEFSIRWQGSLIVEETGDYEFVVKSENGVRLWVNDVDTTLIDEWVSSGPKPREHTATIRLLGGRVYPIRLDTFKYKDKSASIVLRWRPPHKALETIPARYLTPGRVPETMVVATAFPPDDSSTGYPRGTSVSKIWDKATTDAAIEVADYVVEHLDELTGARPAGERRRGRSPSDPPGERGRRGENRNGNDNRKERAIKLCAQLAERAFRRPLAAEQRQFFVDSRFAQSGDVDTAVKRSVLLILKSPRFLYPEIVASTAADATARNYTVASRLALAFWDSLPDESLRTAAVEGRLATDAQITEHAHRLLANSRAKAKVREFFHGWLPFDEAEDVSKDTQAFPGFDEPLIADLRTSLDLFVDNIVWSENSDYRQLILANHWFVNARLANYYGVQAPSEEGFHEVSVDAKERAGVVTHPYLLAALAYHKSSSPIHRGVFATRKLLGRTLRPPPAAIQFMDGTFDPHMTMREKVTELTKSQACQSCHSIINPLGFSLEHYDAVGRFRTVENTVEKDRPIDSTGQLTSPDGKVIRLTGARDLAELAATSPEAHRGFVDQLFQHIAKQPAAAYGPETTDRLVKGFADSGYNIRKLLVEITKVAVLHNIEPQQIARTNEQ
jgi:mono/diheme cytochrome c family protein